MKKDRKKHLIFVAQRIKFNDEVKKGGLFLKVD